MRVFNENQIVVNLMGQAAGDVELVDRGMSDNFGILKYKDNDYGKGETLAKLMRTPAGHNSRYSWQLTAAGCAFILENLQGCYTPHIERRLAKMAEDARAAYQRSRVAA